MRVDAAHTLASARKAAREASILEPAARDTAAEEPDAERSEEEIKADMDALHEAFSAIRTCLPVDQHAFSLKFSIVRDAELGVFIDTPPITDADDQPLEPAIDDCIRDLVETYNPQP